MSPSARRRQLRTVLTPEALSKQSRHIRGFLRSCQHIVPPSNDPVEIERRRAILSEVANQLLSGALLTLRAYEPSHYVALFDAVSRYAKEKLETGKATLVVRRARRGSEFAETLLGP